MRKVLVLPAIVLLMTMAIGGSSNATTYTLTFQNVNFSSTDLGGGELQLTIANALNATGNWSGIQYLEAFAIQVDGTYTNASLAGWNTVLGGLNANGCNGKGNFVCFNTNPAYALSNNIVFDIYFTGGTPDFNSPTLKVDFWIRDPQRKATGDLLSQELNVPVNPPQPPEFVTPLPAALPLFATGLGALGLLGWRRKRKAQAAA